jgi:hypothetical protein
MKYILLIGLALLLFIPPVISIILGGADIGKNSEEIGKWLKEK